MEYVNAELHELEARRNALDIMLQQSIPPTVQQLEVMMAALLAAQNQTTLQRYETELTSRERLLPPVDIITPVDPPMQAMSGDNGDSGPLAAVSQRQQWIIEREAITAQMEAIQAAGGDEPAGDEE